MSRLKVQLRCHDCSKSVLVDADAFIETLQKLIEALEQHMKINREYHINIPDNVDPTYTFRCDDCARSHDDGMVFANTLEFLGDMFECMNSN